MWWSILFTIVGLALFEAVSSVDNAIINAEVLHTMGARARQWFLTWGIFIAVFLVRGLLPFVIVWFFNPALNAWQAFTAAWSADPIVQDSILKSAPFLYLLGGILLIILFLHWFFGEDKGFSLPKIEQYFIKHGIHSDWSKLIFLEIIDMVFSVDGVFGAFAFTLSVPLILLGNGVGVLVVRQLTVSNIATIKKYVYLKNGAMYSVLVLGVVMILNSFHYNVPEYVSPSITFIIIGFFLWKSKVTIKNTPHAHKIPRRI